MAGVWDSVWGNVLNCNSMSGWSNTARLQGKKFDWYSLGDWLQGHGCTVYSPKNLNFFVRDREPVKWGKCWNCNIKP